MQRTTSRAVPFAAVGLVLAVAAALLTFASPQQALGAPDVTPVFIEGASNKTCAELQGSGQSWTELKVDPPANGTYSNGTLTVTVSNLTNTKTFDWSSNIGVDAVFVKAGSAGSNLYVYDPPTESTGDDGLTSPGAGVTNQISHIAFCYDLGATPTPPPTPVPTPTTVSATQTPAPTPTQAPTPTPSPTALAAVALPATGGSGGSTPDFAALLLLAAGVATMFGAAVTLARTKRE